MIKYGYVCGSMCLCKFSIVYVVCFASFMLYVHDASYAIFMLYVHDASYANHYDKH